MIRYDEGREAERTETQTAASRHHINTWDEIVTDKRKSQLEAPGPSMPRLAALLLSPGACSGPSWGGTELIPLRDLVEAHGKLVAFTEI